jgi:hypothetical protein
MTGDYLMMWYLQLVFEWAGWLLAQEMTPNAAFAGLALWTGFGRSPRLCAVLTALVYLVLILA